MLTHTAHPHIEADGCSYNIGQGVGVFGPKYLICKFPPPKTNSKGEHKICNAIKLLGNLY